MKRAILLAAFVAFSLGIAALAAAEEPIAAAPVDDGLQAAPEPVSPADPATPPPDARRWVCPACGAECPGPVHGYRGHYDKGAYGGPQLGPGQAWNRPGRQGRDGDARGHRAGRAGRPGDRGLRAPRGMAPGIHGHGIRGGVAADMMLRHAADLKLTDSQIEKLERLASDAKKELVDLRAEMEKSEIELQSLMASGSDDMTQIKRHLQAVSNARVGIQEARIAHLFAARGVLTDKQKEMVKEEFPRLGRILD